MLVPERDRDLVVQDDAYTADLMPEMALIDSLKRVIDVRSPAFDATSSILCGLLETFSYSKLRLVLEVRMRGTFLSLVNLSYS